MLAVRLDAELEARLNALSKRTGRSKSYIAREALQERIDELEDIAAAEDALRTNDPATNVSLAEVKRRLGLGN